MLKANSLLCGVASCVIAVGGCAMPIPIRPLVGDGRADDERVGRPNTTSSQSASDIRGQDEIGAFSGLPPDGNPYDPVVASRPREAKSVVNVLDDLETMKRDRPDDYRMLKQLLDGTPETIPAQYQQMFKDQLLAVMAHQTPTSSLETPWMMPGTAALVPPSGRPSAPVELPLEYRPPVQADYSTSQNPLRTAVATHVGDIAPNPTVDTVESGVLADTEQSEYRPGQWRDEITEALEALESELIRGKHDRGAKARLEGYRRMLHVVANHPDDAVVPIKELDEEEQEFWKHQLHSLLIALDADDKHAASRRAALALRDLREASHHLANISALDLRNLTFCTKVNSYGEFTEFESYSFRPDEEVVLYVEIDNFAAHPKGDRYETELHGSYQIMDDAGRRVANVVLPSDRQVSNNRRRDYFIPYLITMPAKIAPGTYRLQLAIEDVIGKKSNHASIDFRIR
ncbi:MAG: hypothetical protein CMJ64_01175 [Planctomycetaceae bacterium]|nr:hypothetical protein [Planctomycetaceae bacterium]